MHSVANSNVGDLEDEEIALYASAPHNVEDILCEGSDAEQSPDEIDRKRLRYEHHARRYLQGRMPIIQSASLRGPLGAGWVNPWRYRPRPRAQPEPAWWKPSQGVDNMLFTRENLLKRAVEYGMGHLTPVEALAWCKAEAEALEEKEDVDETSAAIDESDIEEVPLHEGQQEDEGYMEEAASQSESLPCPSSPPAPSAYIDPVLENVSFPDDEPDDEMDATDIISKCSSYEAANSKRPPDSQWLKGSYVSKRARWDAPAHSSPTPMPLFHNKRYIRPLDKPRKSLISQRTPVTPTTMESQTPVTLWSRKAQMRKSFLYSETMDLQSEKSHLPNCENSNEDIQSFVSDSSKTHYHETEFRQAPSTSYVNFHVTPEPSPPSSKPLVKHHNSDNPNSNGRCQSPDTATSLSLPRLLRSRSPDEQVGDVSFVTEIAPSSRNVETFRYKKRRKKSNVPSTVANEIYQGEVEAAQETFVVEKGSSQTRTGVQAGSKGNGSSQPTPGAPMVSDSRLKLAPMTNHAFHSGGFRRYKKVPVREAQGRWEALQPSKPIESCKHIWDGHSQLKSTPQLYGSEGLPNITSDQRVSQVDDAIQDVDREISASPMTPKKSVNGFNKIFALDTPTKLSPFTLGFDLSIGTKAAVFHTLNNPDSALQVNVEGSSVAKHSFTPLSDLTPIRDRNSQALMESGRPSSMILAITPSKTSAFTSVNDGPAESSASKSGRRDDEEIGRRSLANGSLHSVHVSPKLPTPQRLQTLSAAPLVEKSIYDETTMSRNSTQLEVSKSPLKQGISSPVHRESRYESYDTFEKRVHGESSSMRNSQASLDEKLYTSQNELSQVADVVSSEGDDDDHDKIQKEEGNQSSQGSHNDNIASPTAPVINALENAADKSPLRRSQHENIRSQENIAYGGMISPIKAGDNIAGNSKSPLPAMGEEEKPGAVVNVGSIGESCISPLPQKVNDQRSSPPSIQSPWTTVEVAPIFTRNPSNKLSVGSFEIVDHEHRGSQGDENLLEAITADCSKSPKDEANPADSGWQPEITASQYNIAGSALNKNDQDWQQLSRPSTPSHDEIRPLKEFMTPTPSPEQSRELSHSATMRDEPLDTQKMIDAALLNPWESVMKKPSSRKSRKHVSFGLLPSERLSGSQSATTVRRLASPPPAQFPVLSDDDEDVETWDDKPTNVEHVIHKNLEPPFLAPDGVGGYRPKLRESPLKTLVSPAINGVADAFRAADRETERNRRRPSFGTPSRLSELRSISGTVGWESPDSFPTRPDRESTSAGSALKTIDYANDDGEDFSDFLGEGGMLEDWSVEAELKKPTPSASTSVDKDSNEKRWSMLSSGW